MRKKNGLGWIDFFSHLGKYGGQLFVLVPKGGRKSFTLMSGFLLTLGGLILWIVIETMSPEKEVVKGPLDMAPPSAEENGDRAPTTIDDIDLE